MQNWKTSIPKHLILAISIIAAGLIGLENSASAQYTVGGNALSQGNSCFRLTPAVIGNKGYVYRSSSISLNDSFNLKFRVNLGTNNAGGEGIMFVLRDSLMPDFIGGAGNSLGFNAASMDSNSLGVEIDTHEDPSKNDIAADHVAILKNGSTSHSGANSLAAPVQALASNANIEDGNNHTFQIKWSPGTQTLSVFLDCKLRLTYTGDIINDIFDGDDLVFWGLLGTTGGNVNVQSFCVPDLLVNLVDNIPSQIGLCEDDTVQLNAGDTLLKYLWTPSVGLSANNINSPLAFPVDTTQYIVRQSYFCDTLYDTTVVNVNPPNFQTMASVNDASCKNVCDGQIDLSVVGGTGGLNGYDFTWSTGATTEDIGMLCDSLYIVTTQDVFVNSPNYLCQRIDTYYVDEPSLLHANIVNPTKTKCPNSPNCDAEAKVNGSGGTPPYNYLWSSSETNQDAIALCFGFNFVTVYDANNCEAYDTVSIAEPDSIITLGYGDTTICINSIAAIASSSSGGTPPFSYVWRRNSLTGPIVSLSSAEAVTPVVTTEYFVESFDGNGCTGDTSKVLVTVLPPLDIEFVAKDTICPYDTISVKAVGVGGNGVYSFNWENGSFLDSIIVSPDLTRWYTVTVTDFCGTPFASDSVKVQVGGYPDLIPKIQVEEDSICAGKSIYMISSATGGFRGPDEYIFTWQHNGSRADIQFIQPSVTTTYTVSVEDLCLSKTATKDVTIYVGNEVEPYLEFFPEVACKESDVLIKMNQYSGKNEYTWRIDTFGLLADYEYDSLLYKFSSTGCFDFSLHVTSNFGCESDTTFDCGVEILANPIASFSHVPDFPTNVEPMLDFVNTSRATDDVVWYVGNDTLFGDSAFRYEFEQREEPYKVILYATSEAGCFDSSTVEFSFVENSIIRYPNSFSPNGDGINEEFFIFNEGIQPKDFQLDIYDRLGSLVFSADNPNQRWNGRSDNDYHVPMGTYYMILRYRDEQNIERVIHDNIHVVITGRPTGL